MKRSLRRFTLIEMLTVIAIISVLAGLVIPVVIIAQERGRETQAKSDIAALMSALKQLDSDHGRMLKKDGTKYQIGNCDVSLSKSKVLKSDGSTEDKDKSLAKISADSTSEEKVYNAFIAELSAPKNSKFDNNNKVSVNRRKKVYLEPKKGFDPTEKYDDQTETLWRDPWGNPYVLQIPPAQAFSPETATNIPDVVRFRFARLVSAGPDGRLSTPCYTMNETNDWREIGLNWRQERVRRLSRQAGLIDGGDRSRRGDDLVLFLTRNDVDEGERL